MMGQRVVDMPSNVSMELSRDCTGAPVGGSGCTELRPGACDNGAVPKESAAMTS